MGIPGSKVTAAGALSLCLVPVLFPSRQVRCGHHAQSSPLDLFTLNMHWSAVDVGLIMATIEKSAVGSLKGGGGGGGGGNL